MTQMLPVQRTYVIFFQLGFPAGSLFVELSTKQICSLQTKLRSTLLLPNTHDQKISTRCARFTQRNLIFLTSERRLNCQAIALFISCTLWTEDFTPDFPFVNCSSHWPATKSHLWYFCCIRQMKATQSLYLRRAVARAGHSYLPLS